MGPLLTSLAGLVLLILGLMAWRSWRGREAGSRRGRLVETLTDPREAAAILLVQIALLRGQLSLDHKYQIMGEMERAFGIGTDDAEGLFSFGRMAVGQLDPMASLKRLLRPIHDRCTLDEMKDLVDMMGRVGEGEHGLNQRQRELLRKTRQALYLPAEPSDA